MEMEARPLVGHHPLRDWPDRPVLNGGLEPTPAAGPSTAPPSSFTSAPASPSQRRRSSTAHIRPAGPPPNLPIPSVPASAQSTHFPRSHFTHVEDSNPSSNYVNGKGTRTSAFMRPAASPNLAAVAVYTQLREPHNSQNPPPPADSSMEDLSDPPPQSILPASSRSFEQYQESVPDRLLSPTDARPEPRVPSSRRALTRALELAREAVQIDSMNDNPEAAVQAYGRSVALLSEVMERVRRGEDSTESHRRRRRRSVAAQEEEVRRLQNIHDTYADRMNILSIIFSIPPVPYSTSTVYSAMTDSNASISPANSSPSIGSSPQSHNHDFAGVDSSHNGHHHSPANENLGHDPMLDSPDAANSAMFTLDDPNFTQPALSDLPTTSHHPYAIQYDTPQTIALPIIPTPAAHHISTIGRRRAYSNIPPASQPPPNPLPPAPSQVILEQTTDSSSRYLAVKTRQRGESMGHRRTNSYGLEDLEEEHDAHTEGHMQAIDKISSRMDATHFIPDTPRTSKRDSHPLPPLPSPSTGSPGTPRNPLTASKPPLSPRLPNIIAPGPRGSSQVATRPENNHQQYVINLTTTQGTISQRRSKTSAPPSSRSSSPADSTASAGSVLQPRQTASSLPGSAPVGFASGRNRSSSQPGRRPSVLNGRVSPLDPRPPLPSPVGVNGTSKRKTSNPSKLNPNPPLSLQMDPQQHGNVSSLVPPPPVFTSNLPTTPTSPLPPTPPSDPLLKPYHLMNLLRSTMTSTTGGYITRRLHVPHEVWSQGGAKLTNVLEKVRVVAILCSALEELQASSSEHFGAGNVSSGLALGIGSIGRREADAWLSKLEDFMSVCDGVVANFGKKLGVGEGFVVKKTTWSDKIRGFGGLTDRKNLDSPAAYVRGLEKLFLYTQLLDEHTRAALSHPAAPAYAAFPSDIRTPTEQKLKRASEFFASVVLTFVIRDLSQLLDKYAKKCEKWLAE